MDNMANFEIPSDVLDEIQLNIQSIIESFDIPMDNKNDVLKKINFMYTQTKQMTVTDALTRLFNRRHFDNEFEKEYKRAKRYSNDLSVAIIDIDYFKNINDAYGHLCGDYVLKEIAYIMTQNFRQTDTLFRYGGEEFVVILTETSTQNALIPLERLRLRIENHKFQYKDQQLGVTISVGICGDGENPEDILYKADKALYKSKENGRNQISLAD